VSRETFKFISNATWDGTFAYYQTELPHNLSVGSAVEVLNVTSTNNTTGIASAAFNNTFDVVGISSAKSFQVALGENPGTFTNDLSNRTTSLPTFRRKRFNDTYYVYNVPRSSKICSG
jgi:hypothetical protein